MDWPVDRFINTPKGNLLLRGFFSSLMGSLRVAYLLHVESARKQEGTSNFMAQAVEPLAWFFEPVNLGAVSFF